MIISSTSSRSSVPRVHSTLIWRMWARSSGRVMCMRPLSVSPTVASWLATVSRSLQSKGNWYMLSSTRGRSAVTVRLFAWAVRLSPI